MDSGPASGQKNDLQQPEAEVLQQRADTVAAETAAADGAKETKAPAAKRMGSAYRPSHRATFIGLAVVAVILAVNAGVIWFVLRSQAKSDNGALDAQVTVSQSVLDKLGVNRGTVGDSGVALTITPNTQFKGNIVVGGDTSIAGQLKLNGAFAAANAKLTQLSSDNGILNTLNVNGDSTFSNATLRNDLQVNGLTRLQGALTANQLVTINNSLNVATNVSVGGTVSASTLSGRSIISTSTITVGGHIITAGSAPSLSGGSALGPTGTVSISGNDAAGTIAVNIGVGSSSGIVAYVTFRNVYTTTPHVVVGPIGAGISGFYINRSTTGFSIGVTNALSPGGYAFDYIVEQ